jgi:hypothetical protein
VEWRGARRFSFHAKAEVPIPRYTKLNHGDSVKIDTCA